MKQDEPRGKADNAGTHIMLNAYRDAFRPIFSISSNNETTCFNLSGASASLMALAIVWKSPTVGLHFSSPASYRSKTSFTRPVAREMRLPSSLDPHWEGLGGRALGDTYRYQVFDKKDLQRQHTGQKTHYPENTCQIHALRIEQSFL